MATILSSPKIDLQTKTIALVGNPNTGKTSVFNALTGMRQKVGNYPGVTVEKKSGSIISPNGTEVIITDLPGVYSLSPKSIDETIAVEVLQSSDVDVIVAVIDAANLSRNLFLISQLTELQKPLLIALSMSDVALKRGLEINCDILSTEIGVPVIPVNGNKRRGIMELRKAIFEMIDSNSSEITQTDWLKTPKMQTLLKPVIQELKNTDNASSLHALIAFNYLKRYFADKTPNDKTEVFLAGTNAINDVNNFLELHNTNWVAFVSEIRYSWAEKITDRAVSKINDTPKEFSRKLDVVLTHRFFGPFIFLFIFAFVFQSIFAWAELPMDMIDASIAWISDLVSNILPDGALQSLIVDGAIGGVGSIIIFLPQILFLFFFLSLLEDSGYMTRVAFMMDRFMRGAGLSGRSVIPLLSSFACAIPGIMATRTIQNWQERLITIMIAPLMSCSARLPVYVLMIGALMPNTTVLGIFSVAGLTLLSMYFLGIAMAIAAALVFKYFLMRGKKPSSFMMELPPYRLPSIRWTLLQMYERAKIFVTDAGKIILAMSLVLWFLASYPKAENTDTIGEQIRQSYAGQVGQFIEPVIEPLGFDWKLGVGIITSFAAREVLVSTLATIYNVEDGNEESVSLREALRNEKDPITGKPKYTALVAISLMVFFVLACQCMSTVAIVKRETNSWRWPIIMVVYMTVLAYVASFVVYQGGLLLGLG